MICPKCGNTMTQTTANNYICSVCGSSFTDVSNYTQPTQTPNDEMKNGRKGWLIVGLSLFVCLVIFVVVVSVQNTTPDIPRQTYTPSNTMSTTSTNSPSASSGLKKKYTNDEYELVLYLLAKDTVSSYLKSPSTAKFCKQSDCKFAIDNGTFMMTGWVDAQNGFEATIREVWGVMATQEGDVMDIFYVTIGDNSYIVD